MLPPSSAFHPHLCTPIPAFVLPQKFTRPHNDLDQESPWLKTNLTAKKQTNKRNHPPPPKTLTDFQLTQFPAPAQHLTTWTLTAAQRQWREGRSPCFTTVTNLQSQWTLKKHSVLSLGSVIGHFFTFLLLWLTLAKKAWEFATLTVKPPWIIFIS